MEPGTFVVDRENTIYLIKRVDGDRLFLVDHDGARVVLTRREVRKLRSTPWMPGEQVVGPRGKRFVVVDAGSLDAVRVKDPESGQFRTFARAKLKRAKAKAAPSAGPRPRSSRSAPPPPPPPPPPRPTTSPAEIRRRAAEILGVAIDADAATVQAAFKKAALKAHPDRGGSAEEMKKVLAARTVMLSPRTNPRHR